MAQELKRKGWSYRRAAQALGVSVGHLFLVTTGARKSKRLTDRVFALPEAPRHTRRTPKK